MRRQLLLSLAACLLVTCGTATSQLPSRPTPIPSISTALPSIAPTSAPTNQTTVTTTAVGATPSLESSTINTVFIIMMENHNWSDIHGNPSVPYINNMLLPLASHAEQYRNLPGIHPSEPNYLWLEAGTNFGILDDEAPSSNHQPTTQHLVTLLTHAGISWKAYQEGISGTRCPLVSQDLYAPKHNPMVYFDDITSNNTPNSSVCISHVRPYPELATDLKQNKVAHYNFITPDLCNDMHDSSGCATSDSVKNGDSWLAHEVPMILKSTAYQQGGTLFITWDEGEGGDGPIGILALSSHAKGGGYANTIHYTHSSLLRTVQEIFGVTPLLGDAANATDLRDLFQNWP